MTLALGGIFFFAFLGWLIPIWLGADLSLPTGVFLSVLEGAGFCGVLGFAVFFLATALIGLAIPAWTILPLGAVLVLVVAVFDFLDWW